MVKNILTIAIEKGEEKSTDRSSPYFSKECFSQNSIADFVESITTRDLVETNINANDKHFHLTAHHGQQELNELWNRIKNSFCN